MRKSGYLNNNGRNRKRKTGHARTAAKKILFSTAAVLFISCGYCCCDLWAAEASMMPSPSESEPDFTGWQETEGVKFYFSPETGEMLTGRQVIDGKQYYFSPETGEILTGWQEIDKGQYYFSPETGEMVTGWQEIDKEQYYFSPETGKMLTGRQEIGKKRAYYFDEAGVLKTSCRIRNGNRAYYAGKKGLLRSGWTKISGSRYYFSPENSRILTGWQKIHGQYYYFTVSGKKKGSLKTNCIAGTKKSGHYYVDQDGVRTDSAEMNAAVHYVRSHTKESWTAPQKLEACYHALRNSYTYRHYDGVPQGADLSECACSLFSDGRGNCYRYASGMACIAAVIGYRTRVVTGKVSSIYGGWAEHGWAQVLDTRKWKLCDVGMRQFMSERHPARSYVPDAVYILTAKNGKAVWKKTS